MPEIDYGDMIANQIKSLGDKIAADKAERATADEARKKELDAALAATNAQLTEVKAQLAQREKTAITGLDYSPTAEKGKLSWARVIQLCAEPRRMHLKEYGVEKEAFDYMQKTAINGATGTGGGFLVPQTMMAGIVPQLRERSVARQLGATIMSGLAPGGYSLAKSKGGITAEHLNTEEEASGTETVATFDRIELTPRPIASFVPLTRQMMTQSAESLEPWVRSEIAIQIALLQDQSFFLGSGAGGAPRGVLNHPSVTNVSCVSASIDTTAELWAKLVEFVLGSRLQFGLGLSGLGWVCSPRVLYHLAKVKDTTGRPIFDSLTQGSFSASGAPSTVLRYPIVDTAQLTAVTASTAERIAFGPWGDAVIGEWGSLELAMSDQTETNFRKGRATVRGIMEYDVGVFHGNAFTASADYDTTAATP